LNNSTHLETNDLTPFETQLRRILFRFDCPSPEALGEYRLGLLSTQEQTDVKRHLARCPHCRAELTTLDQFLDDLEGLPDRGAASESGAAQRVRTIVAKLVEWGEGLAGSLSIPGRGALAPVPAGVRGEAGSLPRQYVAEDITISVTVEPDPDTTDRRLILGLVLPPDDDIAAWQGAPVVLEQAGATLSTTEVDDLSNFVFSGVVPGAYDITLQGDPHIRLEAVTVT
jgi:hypothetical protein